MIRVLITGCSMHSYDLIRALKDNYDGEEIYVVGINCDDTALLRKGVDAGYVVPRITEESYIPTVIDICEKEKVDVILPFITAELPIMAENRELLESHGVKVSISSMESILASGNKVELAKHYPELMPKQMLLESLFRRFSYEVDTKTGPLTLSLQARAKLWKEMYEDLKKEVSFSSVSIEQPPECCKKPPYFYAGMMENERAADDWRHRHG